MAAEFKLSLLQINQLGRGKGREGPGRGKGWEGKFRE